MSKSYTAPYLFLAPALIVFGLFIFFPSVHILVLSLRSSTFITEGAWIGLANYVRLAGDETFVAALLNSLLYLLVTPAIIVVCLCIAALLDTGIRGTTFFRSLYFFPVVTPMIVVGITWRWLLNEDVGVLNYMATTIGVTESGFNWLTVYPLNLFTVMGVTLWKGAGYYSLIFLAGLMSFPREIEESAMLDGASRVRIFLSLKLTHLRHAIALVAVISSISALKVFDELYVILPGAPMAEKTLIPLLYQTAFVDFRTGYASAMSVVLFSLTLVFSYVQLRFWREE